MQSLDRLLRPRSIAVIGGGAWCANVIRECLKIGFEGEIWAIHPKRDEVGGIKAYPSIDALPGVPDAAFVGVNRNLTVDMVRSLRAAGAGGAVCFASGFSEAVAETGDGADLQAALLEAAGDMPILGPNCYGFINALDAAPLWPDQHGLTRVEKGVALITQSSNIALNLTMQERGLPIAYLVTAGNQAQTDLAQIGMEMLADERVTALGLHIEGIGDLRRFEALAAKAHDLGKPIIALKVGASEQAQAATVSHTASLAGSDAGARAFLARLGIGQVDSLAVLLETLKILHVTGPLASNRIASMSCSGGEASLMADSAVGLDIEYPPLTTAQSVALRDALGPMVALANPLDYHTYIWGDKDAMTACYSAMMEPGLALGCIVLDFPRADRCSALEWDLVVEAVVATREATGIPMAIVSSLPETMPETVSAQVMARGIVPLSGLPDALIAVELAAKMKGMSPSATPVQLPGQGGEGRTLSEAEAKAALSAHGVRVPGSARASSAAEAGVAAAGIGFPVVLKGEGIAHKTEAGAVALNLMSAEDVTARAEAMPTETFLVEEMITDTVAELLIGVVEDPAHGYVLTLAAGGTLTELLKDSASLLVPASEADVRAGLERLKLSLLLKGYRGKAAADMDAIVATVMGVQDYVVAASPQEIEINPLMCGPKGAIAADALIKIGENG